MIGDSVMTVGRSMIWLAAGIAFCFGSCSHRQPLFTPLSAEQTGIDFQNKIEESASLNILKYEYIYNGGGVAIGDVNGDGLPDIYLTANSLPARLYLNLGHMRFKDITDEAGVAGLPGWKTGASFCDVNGDGLPDIYVCYSGNGPSAERRNQLFINKGLQNGIPVFEDKAAAYGLDGGGANSTQAAFLDYDHDGDLDMVLIDHATKFYDPFYNTQKLRTKRHPYFSSRFYRNDSHGDSIHFTDVSEQAGIKGGGNNFNLGVAISDMNGDGWPDMYVTNDYEEQDYLYINQRDGTFRDATRSSVAHTSRYGMGVDIADYNNDGMPDIMVLDMLPADNHRQKLLKGPDDYDKYQQLTDNGYYHQNMRNTLQLNIGVRPNGDPVFSEIGQLAGVAHTDWSWTPLLADFDNDGYKDLYISNGFPHDFTNLDFMRYTVADAKAKYGPNLPAQELVNAMPVSAVTNYLFLNNGDLTFRDVTHDWGMDIPYVGNGAAYADLDNDGDLDLVVNCLNGPLMIWENHAGEILHHHYLTVVLKGKKPNTAAIGARVTLRAGGMQQMQEMYPTRGYQSSVDDRLHFGLGKDSIVDRLVVQWPLGDSSVLENVRADEILTIEAPPAPSATAGLSSPGASPSRYTSPGASPSPLDPSSPSSPAPLERPLPLFEDHTIASGIQFVQPPNPYIDFKYQRWLPYELTRQGPVLCKADVNKDGLEDIFVGGSYGQPGVLFLQVKGGHFVKAPSQPWASDGSHEDAGVCLFDADGDGSPDLYIVSGGDELTLTDADRQDRLYLNDGKGNFRKAPPDALPVMSGTRSCVRAADFDHDGRMDLFVGGFALPGQFPLSDESHLLRNDSRNGLPHFTDVTAAMAPALQNAGIVTDAIWTDINKDGWPDLLVVGQWMPVRLYLDEKGKLTDHSSAYGLDSTAGLWTGIFPVNIKGDTDFVLGNLAPNTAFTATGAHPMRIYAGDIDGDGRLDPLLCFYVQGVNSPYVSRDELVEQVPSLKKRYLHYSDYADATPADIFGPEALQRAQIFEVQELRNCLLTMTGATLTARLTPNAQPATPRFHLQPLPVAAQFSAVWGVACEDFDGDGHNDLLLCGNFFPFRTQIGREDAGKGLVLKGDGRGDFTPLFYGSTGLLLDGDVRGLLPVRISDGQQWFLIAQNSDTLRVIRRATHTSAPRHPSSASPNPPRS